MRLADDFGVRRILLAFPRYAPSFGTLEYSYPLTDGVCANMPPQGLLVIAAYLPPSWEVRFVDENIRRATAEDFLWAEVVFVSGMHIQRRQIDDLCRRAHSFGRTAVLGGSSVSARITIRASIIFMSGNSATPPTNWSGGWRAIRCGRTAR